MVFFNYISMCFLLSHTYKAETLDILIPKTEILAQLYHIQDETIRNMTAIQLFVCPTTPICSTHIDFLQLDKDRPTPQNCCSTCYCTPNCIKTDTCCVDYYENFKDKYHDEIYKCYTPMYRQTETIRSNSKRWLISNCRDVNTVDGGANSWLCKSEYRSRWLSKDYRRGTPVTDKHHMKSYRNMYCALCYELQEEDVIFWTPSVQGNKSHVVLNTSLETITNMVETYEAELNILFIPPKGVTAEAYTCVISQCKETGSWTTFYNFVEQACMFYNNNYRKNGKIYRNIFCAICNGINVSQYECAAELNEDTYFDWSIPYISTYDVRVLDPPPRQPNLEPNKIVCPKGFIWDKVTIGCRTLSCPFYSQLINNNCQLVYSEVKGYRLFVMPTFFKKNKPFPFSVGSIKDMYYNVTSEMNKIILNIFGNASMFPFDIEPLFFVFFVSEYKKIDNKSFECIKRDIIGFHYYLEFTVSIKHENRLIDLKQIIETNLKLLRDVETIGQYSLSKSKGILKYVVSENSPLQLKFRSDLNCLEKMLYSENNDNAFNFDNTILKSSSSQEQRRTQQPSSQQASSPQPPTTQESHPEPSTTQPSSSLRIPTTQPPKKQASPPKRPTTHQPSTVPTYHKMPGTIAYPPYHSSSQIDTLILMGIKLCTFVVFDKHEFLITDTQFIILTLNLTLPHNQAAFCSLSNVGNLCICLEVYEKAVRKYLSATKRNFSIQSKASPIFQKIPIETFICFTQTLFYLT